MDASWHYLRLGRAKSLARVLFEHMLSRGLEGELAGSAVLHGCCYLAVARIDAPTGAWICPLDLTGQYGRHLTGYQALREDDIPCDASSYWCCAPPDFLALLGSTVAGNATHWRTRCAAFDVGNASLGPLRANLVLILASPFSTSDGLRCRVAEIVDARKGLLRFLDHPETPEYRMSRHQLVEHGAAPANPVDVELIVAAARATFIGGNHEVRPEG